MPSSKKILLSVFTTFVLLASVLSLSAENVANPLAGDNAIGTVPPDFTLTGSDSTSFSVKNYAAGRPLVISYVYTSCPHTCPPILKSLKRTFEEMEGPGKRFVALTVSFDPENDTPKVLKGHSDSFGGSEDWRFATADAATIKKFCDSRGFYFEKVGDGFTHANMITVVDADGVIVRQLHGVNFESEEIINAVNHAILGVSLKDGSPGLIGRVKLFLFKYDTAKKELVFNFAGASAAGLAVFVLLGVIGFFVRRRVVGRN